MRGIRRRCGGDRAAPGLGAMAAHGSAPCRRRSACWGEGAVWSASRPPQSCAGWRGRRCGNSATSC